MAGTKKAKERITLENNGKATTRVNVIKENAGNGSDFSQRLPVITETGDRLVHYYCPSCHKTYEERSNIISYSTSERMRVDPNTYIKCTCCGEAVEIDAELIDVIVKLNKMGVRTEYCCEGHGLSDPAYIMFDIHSNDLLKYDPPYMWEYDTNHVITQLCVSKTGIFNTSIILSSWEEMVDLSTWYKDGVLLLRKGMCVAVTLDDDSCKNGIYRCTKISKDAKGSPLISWNRVSGEMEITLVINTCRVLRPILSSNPKMIERVFGNNFDMYKNLYLNALRAWVDELHTYLIDETVKILGPSECEFVENEIVADISKLCDGSIIATYKCDENVLYITGVGPMSNNPIVEGISKNDICKVIISDGVTSIANDAFRDCTNLTSIIIPDGVTSIGADAFCGCTSLTSINIPDSVTSIGIGAFDGCKALTSIIIPDSVTSIGNYAFFNCTNLTSIIIPDSVTSIGNYAFSECTNLTSINYSRTKSQWNNIIFGTEWNYNTGNYTTHCTDGDIQKS